MNKKIKVLVTGAGNGGGQSIIRSLNLSKLNLEVIISDIDKLNTQIYNKNKSIIC